VLTESAAYFNIQRYFKRSSCFVKLYETGLTGEEATWAARKYRSHHMILARILERLGRDDILEGNIN
jgi:hypothetical protein